MSNTPSQSTQPSGSLAPITGEGPITQEVVDAVPIRTASQIFNILNAVHDFRSFFDLGAPSLVFAAITECFENGVGFMGPAGHAIYSITPIEEKRFPDGRFIGHVLLKINNTWGTTLRCRVSILWSVFGGGG